MSDTQPPVKSEDELEKKVKALLVFHLGVHEDTSLVPEVRDWVQLIKQETECHAEQRELEAQNELIGELHRNGYGAAGDHLKRYQLKAKQQEGK